MESIKQEIINNIFENGDKQITGPILQTVLIDMIDDVNVKDQEILSKTGSWDNAVTQIPNLATKGEVTNLSESVARDLTNVDVDLTGYATEQWVESQGYLKEHQDISNLATKTELTQAENNLQGNITSLSESVARDFANVSVPEGVATEAWVQSQDYASKTYVNDAVSSSSVDLTGYATETWVESQGYLKEHQDISGLATKTELNDTKNNLQGNITSLSESVARDLANVDVDLTGYATETWVQNQGYLTEHQDISGLATKVEVTNLSESVARDLTGYATETWVESQGYLTEHQDISGLATKTELNSVSESIQTDITNLSESVANSAVWKKGEGQDSIVKVLTGDNEASTPTATGYAAVATGYGTHATGWNSHAEGQDTIASNYNSHAEGRGTIATNVAEHAEGTYNHSSENQIFSIGAGGDENGSLNRKNAVSVLVVPNSETQVNTASVFVQNVGGYDGTNPEPGTNDLATVINGMSTGGGSSETLWKKGTGQDSIVQKLTGNREANTPTATESGSIATGYSTTASGMYSHAEGSGTNASGLMSHAEGKSTKASDRYSHAEGSGTNASGEASHAEGYQTTASGSYSHAEGSQTNASGQGSHAEGIQTEASGPASHAEGAYSTKASGLASHAEGIYAEASGDGSHAEGRYTIASNQYEHAQGMYNLTSSNQIFSVGAGEMIPPDYQITRRNAISVLAVPNAETQINTASFFVQNVGGYDGTNPEPGTNDLATVINGLSSGGGSSETLWKKGEGQDSIVQVITGDDEARKPKATGTGSIATGFNTTKASGDYSHAEGHATTASGSYSHAEGNLTIASGNTSHAEGDHAKASGAYSHAEGSDTEASGWASHVEGYGTKALKSYSHAEGYYAKASGKYSHAEGYYVKSTGETSHAEGFFTNASGECSHAEGYYTSASNQYEHAQGRYNHSSTNQIFSIGTGNSDTDRRNAVSVLEVSNSGSYTSSVFIQNIGGYDGTNPEPGTNDLATIINGMSSSGGSSSGGSSETLWKKGTGTDSVVQKVTYTALTEPIASGAGAAAIGDKTKASGWSSHAEGGWTEAEGNRSHAEGSHTRATGEGSHAEGYFVVASNNYEHAQGKFNHSSENQIFSVGAGNGDPSNPETATRRNAISVLAVDNSGSYTASFFVQNVGGYDGTNPTPGTNDLATVLNNTETWTFTLEDGSTVTKTIVMR